jgi:hypothetical protein
MYPPFSYKKARFHLYYSLVNAMIASALPHFLFQSEGTCKQFDFYKDVRSTGRFYLFGDNLLDPNLTRETATRFVTPTSSP